jgi:hypothetical protein
MSDERARRPAPAGADASDDMAHVTEDLAAGQGKSSEPLAVPAEDVAELAAIRPAQEQDATVHDDAVDRLGEMTPTRVYQGDLEARPVNVDQPDHPDVANLELLTQAELRDGETDDPNEAAEEGLAWLPPADPPVVPGDDGSPEVAAGFGSTADVEPFDQDHHASALPADDERTERVLEALRAHAATTGLVDRLAVETVGSTVIVAGTVEDLVDEDEIVAVASSVDGVSEVDSRIEVAGLG